MATYTDYFSLKRPGGAESVLRTDINNNTTKIDLVMHQNRQMSADAYDTTETYNTGDIVIYEDMLYKCNADNITGNWDSTKWENTTLAAEIVAGGGAAPDLTGVCGEAYDPTETYAVGDLVIYENVLYKCNTANTTGTWDSTKWDSTTLADEIMNGGGGGGSSTLAGLNDVDITTPSDGQLLIYDDANDEWVNGNVAGVNVQPVIYSTEEREIGVWTDGKPVYMRVVDLGSDIQISYNSWTLTSVSLDGISRLISVSGLLASGNAYYGDLMAGNNNNKLQLQTPRNTSYVEVRYLIMTYTKTADTAGSGTWTPQGVPAVHYSTNEQIVGTWIDGSTLYQKTLYSTTQVTLSDSAWTQIPWVNEPQNVDFIVSAEITNNSPNTNRDIRFCVSKGHICGASKVSGAFPPTSSPLYVTFRYTKSS